MKKSLLILFCMIFVTCAAVFAAKLPVISVEQSIAYQGGQYAVVTTPVIGQGSGSVNVKYDFTVKGKDNNKAVIDCRVVLPADFDIRLLSAAGIQKLETKDNSSDVAALTTFREGNNTIIEFLIPQETNGKRFIEFQFDSSKLKAGTEIPIRFEFTSYRMSWLKKNWPTVAGTVVGVAAGVVVSVVATPAAGVTAGAAAASAVGAKVVGGLVGGAIFGFGGHAVSENFISSETMNEIVSRYKGTRIEGFYQYMLKII